MIRQCVQEDGAVLQTAVLRQGQKRVSGEEEQFLLRNGLSGTQMDFSFLADVVYDLLWLLPLMLAVLWTKQMAYSKPLKAAAVCFVGMACYYVFRQLRIPADMVPTKWSDFSFWTSWWKKEKQNFLYILGSAQGDVQLYGILFLLFSVICNMMSIFTASALFCGKNSGS